MPFKDIRTFIEALEKKGEAQRIDEEVDWNLEAGAITRWANEAGLPAPFFQKLKDYPSGYRLFGEALSNHRRIAIAMDMDPDTPVKELIEEYIRRKQQPIKPVLVSDGPCKENIYIGDEVDLLKFPVPLIHEGDGGRYIGSWHLTISKDLTSDWVNWGMYRHMMHNKNTVGMQSNPFTHVMKIFESWRTRGKPMEIAIAIGVEPISTFCAASPIPYGVSEFSVAGGIRGEPLELVNCETVGLEVPATAEIVIEGKVAIDEAIEEGPFGEYTGYMASHMEPRYVIHVTAVTHRNNPILTMSNEGLPATNSQVIGTVAHTAEYLEALRAQGLPVTAVSRFPAFGGMAVTVAIRGGLVSADHVAHAIWATRLGVVNPYVIVVEDDIDPFNMAEVFHALITKCHPYRGIMRLEHSSGWPLCPFLNRHEQKYLLGAKAYFDCTWPRDWEPSEIPKRCSFRNVYPLEVQRNALATWQKYGY